MPTDTIISIPGDSSLCTTLDSSVVMTWSSGTGKDKRIMVTNASSVTFPSLPAIHPSAQEYRRMIAFVLIYLAIVTCACIGLWVVPGGDAWSGRLLITSTSVLEALCRVVLAAWWLKAAAPRLALIFVEIDVVTLSLVALVGVLLPHSFIGTLRFDLMEESLQSSPGLLPRIFAEAAIKESLKFICYMTPVLLKQVRCASDLLFTGAVAGALGVLYTDIFSAHPADAGWERIVMGILYTMLFTLWSSMGCALVCHLKQGRLSWVFAPLVLVVPITFHACYLMAVAGHEFGGVWAGIVIGYWILSAIVLKLLLTKVLPVNDLFTTAKAANGIVDHPIECKV